MLRLLITALFAISLVAGCAHGSDKQLEHKDSPDLPTCVSDHHMKMKWGMWEAASSYVAPTKRQEFLGRYEEKGEEFKIVGIELKQITMAATDKAVVEVEQEWYDENMVVKKERFVEFWSEQDGLWMRGERITKDEYRKRKKEAADAIEAQTKAPTGATSTSDDDAATPDTPAPQESK